MSPYVTFLLYLLAIVGFLGLVLTLNAWLGPKPAMTSTKGVTGHALGAAGALEAAAVLLSMQHRLIPPTAGTTELSEDMHIDLVMGGPREWTPGPTISNNFGFGGHNGSVIIGTA